MFPLVLQFRVRHPVPGQMAEIGFHIRPGKDLIPAGIVVVKGCYCVVDIRHCFSPNFFQSFLWSGKASPPYRIREGQRSTTGQAVHSGFRALQSFRPCQMNQ